MNTTMPLPSSTSQPSNTKITNFPMEFKLFLDSIEPDMFIDYKTNSGVWEFYNIHNVKRESYEFEISPIDGK